MADKRIAISATLSHKQGRCRNPLNYSATSIIFAAIHPAWMAPLILLLALCLGYAYERTGNLWVCIVIHAAFNMFQTVAFLNFVQ